MKRLVLVLLTLSACSSNGGGIVSTDLAVRADAGAPDLAVARDLAVAPDLSPPGCGAESDYGKVGAVMGLAETVTDDQGNQGLFWVGDLDGKALLLLELYAGSGKLANSMTIAPGTYTIDGDETQYKTCGVCVLLDVALDETGEQTEKYMASGGTVTLTSVSGRLQGSITGATFKRVEIDEDDFTSTPTAFQCLSAATDVTFDDEIEVIE